MNVVLASASPRRRELLASLLKRFSCAPTYIDEAVQANELPGNYVLRLAQEKAMAAEFTEGLIIAADTTVALGSDILGKPVDGEDARKMLQALSGKTHEVHTAIAIRDPVRLESLRVTTRVSFAPLEPALIEQYLLTDEPWDKAGAYGIQGLAGSFVTRIEGSYSSVVGLPLAETRMLLADFGVLPQWD